MTRPMPGPDAQNVSTTAQGYVFYERLSVVHKVLLPLSTGVTLYGLYLLFTNPGYTPGSAAYTMALPVLLLCFIGIAWPCARAYKFPLFTITPQGFVCHALHTELAWNDIAGWTIEWTKGSPRSISYYELFIHLRGETHGLRPSKHGRVRVENRLGYELVPHPETGRNTRITVQKTTLVFRFSCFPKDLDERALKALLESYKANALGAVEPSTEVCAAASAPSACMEPAQAMPQPLKNYLFYERACLSRRIIVLFLTVMNSYGLVKNPQIFDGSFTHLFGLSAMGILYLILARPWARACIWPLLALKPEGLLCYALNKTIPWSAIDKWEVRPVVRYHHEVTFALHIFLRGQDHGLQPGRHGRVRVESKAGYEAALDPQSGKKARSSVQRTSIVLRFEAFPKGLNSNALRALLARYAAGYTAAVRLHTPNPYKVDHA